MARIAKKPQRPRPQLLPCPCCGGKPTYLEGHGSKSIRCTECGLQTVGVAFGSFIQTGHEAEIGAAERWNRRIGDEKQAP